MDTRNIPARSRRTRETPIYLQLVTPACSPAAASAERLNRSAAETGNIKSSKDVEASGPVQRALKATRDKEVGAPGKTISKGLPNLPFPGLAFWRSVARALQRPYRLVLQEQRICAQIAHFRQMPDWLLYDIGMPRGQIAHIVRGNAEKIAADNRSRGPAAQS